MDRIVQGHNWQRLVHIRHRGNNMETYILDLTNAKIPSFWPKNIPQKVRLIPGQHMADFDVHPMCRNTKWYKDVRKVLMNKYTKNGRFTNPNWPIGIDRKNAEQRGAKIIKRG